MNVGCVPIDECVIQLELKHKVSQAVLDDCFRLISAIGAGRQDAQSIRGASVHGAVKVVDEETIKGRLFGVGRERRRVASSLVSRVKWFCLRNQLFCLRNQSGETV